MRCRSLIAGIIALASALVAHSCELQMVGGLAEGMVGVAATLASSSLGNLPGTALGIAVWAHGADQMSTGAYRMWYGQDVDTQTSQALQSVGIPRDWANGIDAGLSAAGSIGVNAVIRTAGVISAERAVATITESIQPQQITRLYRAVKPIELQDIVDTGKFRIPPAVKAQSAEGKYFTSSYKSAKTYGDFATATFKDPPYTIIQTEIPSALLPTPVSIEFGIPAYVIPEANLQGLVPIIVK